ncbi:hypothetical protein [Acinetobacter sp.]|uniref:hypothetical protein n=1 Tax=Acinetobacter sp. TaxID=472 RepID=UPI00388D2DEA
MSSTCDDRHYRPSSSSAQQSCRSLGLCNSLMVNLTIGSTIESWLMKPVRRHCDCYEPVLQAWLRQQAQIPCARVPRAVSFRAGR